MTELALRVALRFANAPAENIAINLLADSPELTVDEAIEMVRKSEDDLWDTVSRRMVPKHEVEKALHELAPKPLSGSDVRVYHATDSSTAKALLRRGFIPETKPRAREGFDYAPGRGIDQGLYVGESPRDVESYGRAILEVTVPKRFLEVPTELQQLGEKDPMRALRSHDGAVINHRLPADAFRLVPDKMAARVAARYKEKKKVKSEDGGTTTVYVYSEKQVQHRNREKAKRIETLTGSIKKLRAKVKKDLRSSDPETMLTALAVGLIDHTYERVGNDESAKDGHFGVTGWKKKHVSFGSKGPTIKYVGKSGVKHEKKITDAGIRSALKDAYEAADNGDSCLLAWEDGRVTAEKVNAYLEDFDITAKDLRGFHANDQMRVALKDVRAKGKKLPEDKKERAKQLKEEFKEALELTAEEVGHEASTLKSQYLVPGLEDSYLKDGTVIDKLASIATYADLSSWSENITARFKAPRQGFPDDTIAKVAEKWTADAESKGHDLGDWKQRYKGDPSGGWRTKCVKCNMTFEIERRVSRYAIHTEAGLSFHATGPIVTAREWPDSTCVVEPRDYIRGMFVKMDDPEALLQRSPGEIAKTLLAVVVASGLGKHWTKPSNRVVSENYAMGHSNQKGIPVLVSAQFRREDQRRNYKPEAFTVLVEWGHENETYLAKHEILRLQAIEWYDGTQWVKHDLHDLKAKTASYQRLAYEDKIPGGLADNKKPEDFDQTQLAKGVKVELEHTSDRSLAQEIAMDHLTEDPSYYVKLERMEAKD
jgi:DNA topoisomerase I